MNVIEFNHVWKKFKRGEKLNSLRDFMPVLFKSALTNNGISLKKEEFWALQDISFEIKKGEVVGLIGSNGAGKSTSLKLLAGIIKPNKGEVKIRGRLSALIEVTAGFHPELTGRENVYLNGTIIGMNKKEIDLKFDEIVEFSGIAEFIDTPVKRYSSGMYSRLGFSIAAHMEPDILLVDEVLSVGDISFQAKCAQKMRELLHSGTTIVFVSHNLALVQSLCKRVYLLDGGKLVKEGNCEEVIPYYQNKVYASQEEDLKKRVKIYDERVYIKQELLVDITRVTLTNQDNKIQGQFEIGESITITIEFVAKQIIKNPIFLLEILRPDGVLYCSCNSKYANFDISIIQNKGSVQISLKDLNLAPGLYIVKNSIWDKELIHPFVIRSKDILKIYSKTAQNSSGAIVIPTQEWR